jgi:transcriptional regulator with XRE-family HTH domain
LSVIIKTPQDTGTELTARAKARRLALNLSQEGLARRSGVAFGTIKRFETTGYISLQSLLKIALVLGALDEFDALFKQKTDTPASIDDLLKTAHTPQRGRKK